MKFLMLIHFLLMSLNVQAQTPEATVPVSTTAVATSAPRIYSKLDPGFFGGEHLIVDGQELENPLYGLDEALKSNPLASEYAHTSEKYMTWGFVALGVGTAGAITYLFATSDSDPDEDHFKPAIYWGIFGTGLLTTIILQKTAMSYRLKAINTFNGVPQDKISNFKFSVGPGVVALSFDF